MATNRRNTQDALPPPPFPILRQQKYSACMISPTMAKRRRQSSALYQQKAGAKICTNYKKKERKRKKKREKNKQQQNDHNTIETNQHDQLWGWTKRVNAQQSYTQKREKYIFFSPNSPPVAFRLGQGHQLRLNGSYHHAKFQKSFSFF